MLKENEPCKINQNCMFINPNNKCTILNDTYCKLASHKNKRCAFYKEQKNV